MNFKKEMREWEETNPSWVVNPKEHEGEKLYQRFCSSRIGYFLHLVGYQLGWHISMITDPLNSGGLFAHLRSWLWNLWYVDIYWPIKHKIDRRRRPEFHKEQDRFFRASLQAMDEGLADEMDISSPFDGSEKLVHGVILGERYFSRLKEILDEKQN